MKLIYCGFCGILLSVDNSVSPKGLVVDHDSCPKCKEEASNEESEQPPSKLVN